MQIQSKLTWYKLSKAMYIVWKQTPCNALFGKNVKLKQQSTMHYYVYRNKKNLLYTLMQKEYMHLSRTLLYR